MIHHPGMRTFLSVCLLFGSALAGRAADGMLEQKEAEALLEQPPSDRILDVLKEFESRPDIGLQVEMTRDYIDPAKLALILDAFIEMREDNYVLRPDNIHRLVIGSLFATSQTEETYLVNGVPFNKLRLVVDAGADLSDIRSYFENPMRALTANTQRGSRPPGEGDEPIEELESISVQALGVLDRLRALSYRIDLPFGSEIAGRLIGTTGPASPFNRYNFRYSIEAVDGAELVALDPRSGRFRLEAPEDFFGEIEVTYRVSLFEETSAAGTLTIGIEPPLRSMADTFDLRAGRPVDILYVVDNSSGTEKQQAQLAESFVEFIEAFGNFNRKIRIAAIATSSRTAWRGELLKLPGGESMLSSSDPDFVDKVKALIQPGAERERRQSAILPTNNFFASETRKEFLRDDAFFSMIIISEKDDNYLETGDPDYIMRIYRHTMDVIKDPEDMRVDAVVKYGTKTWFGRSKQGEVYAMLAREFGGRVIDITQDFTDDLIQIGYEISRRAQESFDLSFPVYDKAVGNMQVFVDEQPVSRNSSHGWSYHPGENRIRLHGQALERSFGKVIKVFYSTIDRRRLHPGSGPRAYQAASATEG